MLCPAPTRNPLFARLFFFLLPVLAPGIFFLIFFQLEKVLVKQVNTGLVLLTFCIKGNGQRTWGSLVQDYPSPLYAHILALGWTYSEWLSSLESSTLRSHYNKLDICKKYKCAINNTQSLESTSQVHCQDCWRQPFETGLCQKNYSSMAKICPGKSQLQACQGKNLSSQVCILMVWYKQPMEFMETNSTAYLFLFCSLYGRLYILTKLIW